jgi:uncharacterized membrane protein
MYDFAQIREQIFNSERRNKIVVIAYLFLHMKDEVITENSVIVGIYLSLSMFLTSNFMLSSFVTVLSKYCKIALQNFL